MRDKYKDHEYWRDCAEFCAKYDQNSFDPKYDTLPIETFIPMLKEFCLKLRNQFIRLKEALISSLIFSDEIRF